MPSFTTIRNYLAMFLLLFFSFSKLCNAQVKSYLKTDFGVSFILNTGMMNIYLIKDGLAEIKYTHLEKMPEKKWQFKLLHLRNGDEVGWGATSIDTDPVLLRFSMTTW